MHSGEGIEFLGGGRYFMSQEQQDEVVGRLIRERREYTERLTLLEVEARKLGDYYVNIGNALRGPIASIVVNTEGTPVTGHRSFVEVRKLDIEQLRKLVNDYKDAKTRLASGVTQNRPMRVT